MIITLIILIKNLKQYEIERIEESLHDISLKLMSPDESVDDGQQLMELFLRRGQLKQQILEHTNIQQFQMRYYLER